MTWPLFHKEHWSSPAVLSARSVTEFPSVCVSAWLLSFSLLLRVDGVPLLPEPARSLCSWCLSYLCGSFPSWIFSFFPATYIFLSIKHTCFYKILPQYRPCSFSPCFLFLFLFLLTSLGLNSLTMLYIVSTSPIFLSGSSNVKPTLSSHQSYS